MTPTPEEIAALLALPEEARWKLAECPGPGWAIDPIGVRVHPWHQDAVAFMEGQPFDWLPCDPIAIVQVAARLLEAFGEELRVSIWQYPDEWSAELWRDNRREDGILAGATNVEDASGASPHIAALRLLAQAWEKPE